MSQPLVSVIVPTYNRADCLSRTLRSALEQSHRNVEVIVIDDGSTDGTGEMLSRDFPDEPRLRYVYQANGGVCAARNHGIRLVRGDYACFLDSDDLWHPWKLELQLACMQRLPHVGMCWTDMDAVDPDGVITSHEFLRQMYSAYRWFPGTSLFQQSMKLREVAPDLAGVVGERGLYFGDIYSQMIMGNLVHTSTVMVRRDRLERVGGFKVELKFSGEDYDYHLRTCREGPVAFADVPSILYLRGRTDQLTRPEYMIHMAENFVKTITAALEQDADRIVQPKEQLDEMLADAHAWLAAELVKNEREVEALRHYTISLAHKPAQYQVYAALALALVPRRMRGPVRGTIRGAYRRLRALLPSSRA